MFKNIATKLSLALALGSIIGASQGITAADNTPRPGFMSRLARLCSSCLPTSRRMAAAALTAPTQAGPREESKDDEMRKVPLLVLDINTLQPMYVNDDAPPASPYDNDGGSPAPQFNPDRADLARYIQEAQSFTSGILMSDLQQAGLLRENAQNN